MARILIVDDAAFMRMMLANILKRDGHLIVGEAENGKEAVEKYQELSPDLVTLDITMPVMNGLEALKQIRALDPDATCVMCSAMGQQGIIIETIKAGATDYVLKPFQADRVIEAVSKALAKA